MQYFRESAEGQALASMAINETPDGAGLFHRNENDIQRELYDRERREADAAISMRSVSSSAYPIPLHKQVPNIFYLFFTNYLFIL